MTICKTCGEPMLSERPHVHNDTQPERFREVEPLWILGEMNLNVRANSRSIKVRMWTDDPYAYLTITKARALRDWLNKALPAEPEVRRIRLKVKRLPARKIPEEKP